MKKMRIVERANQLLDQGLDPKAAVATLLDTAPIEEKVEWFDEVAGQYLVYQLSYERKKDSSPEESAG